MTPEQKGTSFNMKSCLNGMNKIMSSGDTGCDCKSMIAQVFNLFDNSDEWHEMMSKKDSCCGTVEG